MDYIGQTIGRYEVTGLIGSGAMAHVYNAYDPEIGRSVAIKILKEEHCHDEEIMSRFYSEGKAAGALMHPNIVTIHDVGKLRDVPYIMMELLDGEDLGCLLERGDHLPVTTVIKIAMQLAKALDYAHAKGIVHRDIKPDNIVIGTHGETAKIADFGVARIKGRAAAHKTTLTGAVLGTPRYMSPEQATGKSVDGRSDLFSLGTILYEALTNAKAFDARSIPTLITQILDEQPTPMRELDNDIPIGLQSIVDKLLQKKPEQRFQSGEELYEALERELHNLREDDEKGRYVPLEVKWTGIMGFVVAVVMTISSTLVYRAQSEALKQQAIDSGMSLAKVTAVQVAMPVLAEDWITLDALVVDASQREAFEYLIISSHDGQVRSATDKILVGEPWHPPQSAETILREESSSVVRLQGDSGSEIFNFNLPILFNETRVGEINIGINQTPRMAALDTTRRMMIALACSIVFAVLIVFYVFNKAIVVRNIRLVTRTLRSYAKGNSTARISKSRSDEFGELFSAFNNLADNIENTMEERREISSPPAGDTILNEDSLDNTVVAPRGPL